MEPIRVSQDFLTVAAFKAQVSQVLRDLRDRKREQVVVTHQGKPTAVVISAEVFDQLCERERFLTAVARGMTDSRAGRVVPQEEVLAEFENRWSNRS